MAVLLEIYVPKETVSDEFATIAKLYFKSGDAIKQGDVLIDLETSKTIVSIEAEFDGFIDIFCTEGEDVEISSLLMNIVDSMNAEKQVDVTSNDTTESKVEEIDTDTIFSKKALELMSVNNISKAKFVNEDFINKDDILNFIKSSNIVHLDTQYIESKIQKKKNNIFIIGTGGHALNLLEIIESYKKNNMIGFINSSEQLGNSSGKYKIIGINQELDSLQNIKSNFPALNLVIGFGHINKKVLEIRQKLIKDIEISKLKCNNILHKKSIIENSVVLGNGNQVFANAVLSTSVKIGNFNIINTSAIISHDCIIGNNSHIAPGAVLGGFVTIGDNVIIGMNATIFAGVTIPDNTIVQNNESVLPKHY